MFNADMLRAKIYDSGMTIKAIARKSGILRETLYNRFASGDFKASEIERLTDVLRLTRDERDAIFFAEEVN